MTDSLSEARRRARRLAKAAAPVPEWLKRVRRRAEFTYWLGFYFGQHASAPVFLHTLQTDAASLLCAAVGHLERTVYLHGRSILENVARHAFYQSHESAFAREWLRATGRSQKPFRKMLGEVYDLPLFRSLSTRGETHKDAVDYFKNRAGTLYGDSSRSLHASTTEFRLLHQGLKSIEMDDGRGDDVAKFFDEVYDVVAATLATTDLGEYMLISQPIRRYLIENMTPKARNKLLVLLSGVSLHWARHQRSHALAYRHDARGDGIFSRSGVYRTETSASFVVVPS